MFDFMVYDRTNDNSTMLDTLETSNESILLCITTTTDKTFKDVEASVGIQNLYGDSDLYSWNSSNSVCCLQHF